MRINGYEIAYSEDELARMFSEKKRDVVLIDQNFLGYKDLSDGDKKALEHLVKAAKLMNNVSLEQDHHLNLEMKTALEETVVNSTHAALALRLFNSFNGVEGLNGVDPKPIEIFKNVHGMPGRNFYPIDLGAEEFHKITKSMIARGKIDEVKKILSQRSMVRRNGDELEAIDYTEYFANDFSKIANELELAAHYTTDEAFKDYLGWQAQALIQNNDEMDMLADKHWAVLQDTPLEFTLGRECYDDEITPTVFNDSELMELLKEHKIEVNSKDMLGIRVGIVNKKGTELILQFKEHMTELAKLMPYSDQYEQSVSSGGELKQTMVDADLVALAGDYAQCRGSITTAQNLPNNDKLAIKTGGGRRNVYHRQVRMSTDKQRDKAILEKLVSPELHKYYNPEADHLFVVGHENGHSLGPNSEYQTALGSYKHIIEEHKADIVSIAMMPEYVKTGVITAEQLKEIYVTWVAYRLFVKAEPQMMLPHRIADLMQFYYLLEKGAISFDDQFKLHIDFGKFPKVINQFLEETVVLQLSKSPQKAKEFIDRYAVWGETSQRIAQIQNELGLKPYIEIKSFF